MTQRRQKRLSGVANSFASRRGAIAVAMAMALSLFMPGLETLGADPAAAVPATAEQASRASADPRQVFIDDFEHNMGAATVKLKNYVGAQGTTYTGDAPWQNSVDCNNVILRYENPVWASDDCSDGGFVQRNVQRLADVLGQVEAGVVGGQSSASPVNGSTAATRLNHAVSAFTYTQNMANNLVVLESTDLPNKLLPGRFYTASIDVAELSCEYLSGNNNSRLDFALVVDNNLYKLQDDPIRACNDSRVAYYTSPLLNGQSWGSGGDYVAAGRYYSQNSYLMPSGGQGNARLEMRNQTGNSQGNDFAYDNLELVDATPQLVKSFFPASVEAGSTSTLTLTVNNTSELSEKSGWGFTDTLPDGLVIAPGTATGGTCSATVVAPAEGNTITVSEGFLAEGEASCTITVVVATTDTIVGNTPPVQYQNCAANIGGIVGLLPPECASVEFYPPASPNFEIEKAASPASGEIVYPGEVITYTLTGTNSGNTLLDPAVLEDSLEGLWGYVAYNNDVTSVLDGGSPQGVITPPTGGTPKLIWTGELQPGETVTVEFSVTVLEGSGGRLLENQLSGSATPPGGIPITPDPEGTEHRVPAAGFEVAKTANPASGSEVNVGEVITYTITGENTGGTLLKPVVITDDFAGLSGFVEYNGDISAVTSASSPDGTITLPATGDQHLVWTGELQAGETVTIRYSVTVLEVAGGQTLSNRVTGAAQPPVGPPIETPPDETEHPVLQPGFIVEKSSDPADGALVNPGDEITYTVRGVNTGATVLDPVVVADDLSDLWEFTEFQTPPGAQAVLSDGSDPGTLKQPTDESQNIVWEGSLQPGETVTITYTVVVAENAAGQELENVASGIATPPGGTPIAPPPADTEHRVPTPGFELNKSANPGNDTAVMPDEVITYTVTGENTGEVELNPATVSDDLSGMWDYVTFLDGAKATIGGTPTGALTLPTSGSQELLWEGTLQPDEIVTLTYQVRVNDNVAGVTLKNLVTAEGTPPGEGPPIIPPPDDTEHPVLTPGFTSSKTSNPASGISVNPGQAITYTLAGVNMGQTPLTAVTLTDDLSGVWPHATYNDDAVATIAPGGVDVSAGITVPTSAKQTLTWVGDLQPGERVTVTFSVNVDADSGGEVVGNSLTSSAKPPGEDPEPIVPPPTGTENPVLQPGFEMAKTADPASGQDVYPGERITYTLRGSNTGETVLDPVILEDDLAGLWEHVSYNNDARARINGGSAGGQITTPTQESQELRWEGRLYPGQTVEVTFSVTVDLDTNGQLLENVLNGSAVPPGGEPITPDPEDTEHRVPAAGFEVAKTANPASGSAVNVGAVITYTLTGENTGEKLLDPVVITDDFAGLSSFVEYNGDISAETSASSPNGTITLPATGDQYLVWTGELQAGETVTITYSVTVLERAGGTTLNNRVTGEGQPPVGPPIETPPDETEHPVLQPGFVVEKSSDPADGALVNPGDEITYTVRGVNTGATVLDPVVVADDLSDLWEFTELVGGPTVTLSDGSAQGSLTGPADGEPHIVWEGSLKPGETVTITYTVRVLEEAAGEELENFASGIAMPPGGTPIAPPPVDTEHRVPVPGFQLSKSANPGNDTAVMPGDLITYTVTGLNDGEVVLDPAVVSDDLSEMWGYVTFLDGATATIGGVDSGALTLPTSGSPELVWEGTLQQDEAVTLTYQVRVNDNVAGVTLKNLVTAEGQPPGEGPPVIPPPDDTEHPVLSPGFTASKTSTPGSGSSVNPGQRIAYSLTGVNSGQTPLTAVTLTDDLSGVWPHATYNDDAVATKMPGGVNVSAGLTMPTEATPTLTWVGDLQPGEGVTVTYSVNVHANAGGQIVGNSLAGSATPPGEDPDPIVPPPTDTEHPVLQPGFELAKGADPASSEEVYPGDVIAYTLTGTNSGETSLTPVILEDSLEGIWEHVSYNNDAHALINGERVDAGLTTPTDALQQLRWEGDLYPGQTVTVTFTVTVGPESNGQLLENVLTGSAMPPGGEPIIPEPEDTVHPVPTPGFALQKTSNPTSGDNVFPGEMIEYTVTGENTGDKALDPVTITDDQSGLGEFVAYNDDVFATINGFEAAGELTLGGEGSRQVSWTGALEPGETVTITYSVRVLEGAVGQLLANTVTGEGSPPGGETITPPPSETEHPVPVPGFVLAKSADPASGTVVQAGDRITYTVAGENTGATTLDPVTIVDDLSGLWEHATYNGDAFATINGTDSAGDLTLNTSGKPTLEWNGMLEPGESVTITYSVTVRADAGGHVVKNHATASATPPGMDPIMPPPANTEHKVLQPNLVATGGAPIGLPTISLVLGLMLAGGGLLLTGKRRRNRGRHA